MQKYLKERGGGLKGILKECKVPIEWEISCD